MKLKSILFDTYYTLVLHQVLAIRKWLSRLVIFLSFKNPTHDPSNKSNGMDVANKVFVFCDNHRLKRM